MVELGYTISSEEFRPQELIDNARRAEETGFTFALISDHFHPWIESQGQSPFVWSTLGGISQATTSLRVGTGVTCPLIRIHPVIIAQAAATVADLFEGRFFLGVGAGEYLNEHITGEHWPPVSTRHKMLREAIAVIRELWQGDYTTHDGDFYSVENAKIYTLPQEPPPIYVAAAGPKSASLAGELGDGLINTAPKQDIVKIFAESGGEDKPRYAQVTICWGEDEQKAAELALKNWANAGIPGQISQELALPRYFDEVAQLVTIDTIKESVPCGPDPEKHIAQIQTYIDAGFDHIYIHQIGPDQEGFLRFAEKELLPHFAGKTQSRAAD